METFYVVAREMENPQAADRVYPFEGRHLQLLDVTIGETGGTPPSEAQITQTLQYFPHDQYPWLLTITKSLPQGVITILSMTRRQIGPLMSSRP